MVMVAVSARVRVSVSVSVRVRVRVTVRLRDGVRRLGSELGLEWVLVLGLGLRCCALSLFVSRAIRAC